MTAVQWLMLVGLALNAACTLFLAVQQANLLRTVKAERLLTPEEVSRLLALDGLRLEASIQEINERLDQGGKKMADYAVRLSELKASEFEIRDVHFARVFSWQHKVDRQLTAIGKRLQIVEDEHEEEDRG